MIVDATDAVLGRLATKAAKAALRGEEVVVINAEKAVISGNPKRTLEKYQFRRDVGGPHHGPFPPRTPDGIVRRVIRGMVRRKKAKGREAFKRVKVFMGHPEGLKGEIVKPEKTKKDLRCDFMTVDTLAKRMGWRG